MGAEFNVMTVDGKASKKEVIDEFDDRCESDGFEYGHSYSGSFSEFSGLEFTGKTFGTEYEAEEYINDHGQKWGPAIAVRYSVIKPTKRMIAHKKAITTLRQKIYDAESKLGVAQNKMRVNNRSTKPAYVIKAESNVESVKALIKPKIVERENAVKEIESKLAAKSKKSRWMLGGSCSS